MNEIARRLLLLKILEILESVARNKLLLKIAFAHHACLHLECIKLLNSLPQPPHDRCVLKCKSMLHASASLPCVPRAVLVLMLLGTFSFFTFKTGIWWYTYLIFSHCLHHPTWFLLAISGLGFFPNNSLLQKPKQKFWNIFKQKPNSGTPVSFET